jgi:hypothetical protein
MTTTGPSTKATSIGLLSFTSSSKKFLILSQILPPPVAVVVGVGEDMGVVCSSGVGLTTITVDIGEESGDSKPGSDDTPPVLSVSDVAATLVGGRTLVGDRGGTLLVAKGVDWGRLCPGVVCEVLGAVDDGEIEGRVEEEGRGKEEESLVRSGSDDVVSKWDVDSINEDVSREDVSSDDANADST